MKDYAEQQRRLLQDISNLMLRNRDLLRQREEEERQRAALQEEALRVAAQSEAEAAAEAASQKEALPDNEARAQNEIAVGDNEVEKEKELKTAQNETEKAAAALLAEKEAVVSQDEAGNNQIEAVKQQELLLAQGDVATNVKSESEADGESELGETPPEVVSPDDVVPQLTVPPSSEAPAADLAVQETGQEAAEEPVVVTEETMNTEAAQGKEAEPVEGTPERGGPESRGDFGQERLLGAGRSKGDAAFRLDLPLTSRVSTLESPAFIPESALPVVTPPTEEDAARAAALAAHLTAASSPEYNPLAFPPSPMVGTARPISGDDGLLKPDGQDGGASGVRQLSPNSRRKFLVSRVAEAASPVIAKTTPATASESVASPAKHSNESDVAAEASSLSAFQSAPDNNSNLATSDSGHQKETTSHAVAGDTEALPGQEPVSLPDNSSLATTPTDLNENPTQQGVAPATLQETSQQQQPASCHGDSSSTSDTSRLLDNSCAKTSSAVVTNSSSTPSDVNKPTIAEKKTTSGSSGHVFPGGDDGGDSNHNVGVGGTPPDFHTSLTLNGMRVELASVIDSLEEKSGNRVPASAGSAPGTGPEKTTNNPDLGEFARFFLPLCNAPPNLLEAQRATHRV